MPNVPLRDILILARQESYRMRHFYLGVEHLFIALLEVRGGLAASLLEDYGLTTDYVVDAIRRRTGKGGRQRLWPGLPNTPRADVVLSIAHDLALEDSRGEISERDLLNAILEERDSIPTRVLSRLGLDIDALSHDTRTRAYSAEGEQPYVRVDFSPDFDPDTPLTEEQLFILRRMFYGYAQIRIERRLRGGYTGALILVVTPIHGDGREDAAVVVKVDHADAIVDEAQRYEAHVKNTLPPLTARVEDKPTVPETSDLAGIRYTFIANEGGIPHDLRAIVRDWSPEMLGDWLRDKLYAYFGKTWWQQRRPFRFQVWSEYDWLLPPALTLEAAHGDEPPPNSHIIRDPVRRSRLRELEYGDIVVVENFIVQRVYDQRDAIQLSIGRGMEAARRACKIEVRGLNLSQNAYYRGEIVERLIGRVWKTRSELLNHAARALEPDFDLRAETVPGIRPVEKLPNPIIACEDLLDEWVVGSMSKLHGDLHLGNILVGPSDSPFLIDFAHTRDGHTLFDWANLEVSLLSELVLPLVGEDWDAARLVVRQAAALNGHRVTAPAVSEEAASAMSALAAVRQIVRDCLASPDYVGEYYTALALCALRAITWETMSIGSRRLMFLIAGLAMYELRRQPRAVSPLDTISQSGSGEPTDST